MTLAEFLALMEAQYGRSGTTEDVLNIPIDQAQQYLELAAQQYGNIGAVPDWAQRYADPGGNGSISPQMMWAIQNGVRLTPTLGGPSANANGMLPPQITGTTGILGQFRDPETGKYYNLAGQYDAQGNLQDGAGIYEYSPHAGNNFFSAIGPAVRTIGGAMAGAYGLNAALGAGGAAGGAAAAGMTPAEALAAGVAPAPVGGGSMAGVVGGTGGAAAAGGGLLSQLGQGASTVGGFLRDNASWLAPAAGAVAGALGTETQELTPAQQQGIGLIQQAAEAAPQTQAQMQGLLSQATTPQMAAINPLFGLDNPALTGAIDRAQQDLARNFNTLAAPKFAMGSSFGSSGLGELEALARKDVADSMANIGTQMRYQNYGLQAQLGESQASRQDAMANSNANRAMSGVSAAGNIGMYPAQLGGMLVQNGGEPPAGNRWAGALGGGLLGAQIGGWMTQPQQQPQGGWMPASNPQPYFGGIQPKAWNGVAS